MTRSVVLVSLAMATLLAATAGSTKVSYRVTSRDEPKEPKLSYTDGRTKLGKGGKRRQRKERGW